MQNKIIYSYYTETNTKIIQFTKIKCVHVLLRICECVIFERVEFNNMVVVNFIHDLF